MNMSVDMKKEALKAMDGMRATAEGYLKKREIGHFWSEPERDAKMFLQEYPNWIGRIENGFRSIQWTGENLSEVIEFLSRWTSIDLVTTEHCYQSVYEDGTLYVDFAPLDWFGPHYEVYAEVGATLTQVWDADSYPRTSIIISNPNE